MVCCLFIDVIFFFLQLYLRWSKWNHKTITKPHIVCPCGNLNLEVLYNCAIITVTLTSAFYFCLSFCGRNQAGVIFSWNHRRPYILQCREEGCSRSQDCQTWGECKIMWALIRVITFLICQKIFCIASAIKIILLLFFLHLGIKKHVNRQHMSKAEDADPLGKPRNAVNDHGSTAR